jgi:hypothetical protein
MAAAECIGPGLGPRLVADLARTNKQLDRLIFLVGKLTGRFNRRTARERSALPTTWPAGRGPAERTF